MLRIAVCDDEQLYLDKTRAMLDQYAAEHDVEITAEAFMNPSVLLDSIESGERHDIYLLDIYMESAMISIFWTSTCPAFPA